MRFLIGVCTLIWAVSAIAAPTASKRPLTLTLAIASVLENNPQLQAANFDNQAAAARIRQEAQEPPWEMTLELENLAGTGESKRIRNLETSLSLARVLELGNKAQLRGNLAQTRATLLRNEQDAQRLDLLAETVKRFLRIAHVQAKQALAKERVDLEQRTLKVVNRRFQIGKAPKAERSQALINLAKAELELEESDHLLASARRNLSILWGELIPGFRQVELDLYHMPAVPDLSTLEQLVEQNPSLVRFATQQRLAEARLRLAKASRQPDIELQGGLRHFNGPDDLGLLFSLRVPLGNRKRADPLVDEAIGLSSREPLLTENKRLALRATLFELSQELIHNRDVIDMLQERIIPAAKSALADYNQGYAAGRYSLLELTQAQDLLLQARFEALNAAVDYHYNRTEVDRLTGAALSRIPNSGVSR